MGLAILTRTRSVQVAAIWALAQTDAPTPAGVAAARSGAATRVAKAARRENILRSEAWLL